jgi:hypothetical protein
MGRTEGPLVRHNPTSIRNRRGVTTPDARLGHAPAHLWVFENNPRGQALYAKSGFSPDGNSKVDPDTGIWEQRLTRN